MAIQQDIGEKSTRTKVRELISDLEKDLDGYERLAQLRMISQQEVASVRNAIRQSIADLRSIHAGSKAEDESDKACEHTRHSHVEGVPGNLLRRSQRH